MPTSRPSPPAIVGSEGCAIAVPIATSASPAYSGWRTRAYAPVCTSVEAPSTRDDHARPSTRRARAWSAAPPHATTTPTATIAGGTSAPPPVARSSRMPATTSAAARTSPAIVRVVSGARRTPRTARYALCPTTTSHAATRAASAASGTAAIEHERRAPCDSAADLGHETDGHPEGRAARPSGPAADRRARVARGDPVAGRPAPDRRHARDDGRVRRRGARRAPGARVAAHRHLWRARQPALSRRRAGSAHGARESEDHARDDG